MSLYILPNSNNLSHSILQTNNGTKKTCTRYPSAEKQDKKIRSSGNNNGTRKTKIRKSKDHSSRLSGAYRLEQCLDTLVLQIGRCWYNRLSIFPRPRAGDLECRHIF